MRNWYGNHKIGVFGLSNSGKTVFLTSLLWHLENQNPNWFPLKDSGHISSFRIIESDEHDFNFLRHKNTFLQRHKWPEKTTDYAIAKCKFRITGPVEGIKKRLTIGLGRHLCERSVSFLDIPGERVSDILIWKAKDYKDWVKKLFRFWRNDPVNEQIMRAFCELASNPDIPTKQLEEVYKRSMWYMLDAHCPITPSTYYLGTDGSMLGDKNNSERETAIQDRPIWCNGNFLPLPESWYKKNPDEYKKMQKMFYAYRKQVLKPLFQEMKECDNYILCIDIPSILNNGAACLRYTQQIFKSFIEWLEPKKFVQFLDKLGLNPPRLAYVATKSDIVLDKNHLECLLKDFCSPLNFAGFSQMLFTCSACKSSERKEWNGKDVLVGKDCDAVDGNLLLEPDELPSEWPDSWDPETYLFQEIAPKLYSIRPPDQYNLNKIFEFIVEGIKP